MVDDKIEDECWVTVVATGYGDRPTRRSTTSQFREPAGEPRIRRTRERESDFEIEVPEFVPGR
jgi:cell division protein FtsZ